MAYGKPFMLSKVEHIERLRELPAGQRLRYSLVLALAVAAAFVGSIALAILIATLLFTIINGSAPTVEDGVALGVPIVIAFLAAIGFSSNPFVLGQTVQQTARRAARFGLINGFFTGLVFGILWSIIAGLTAVRFERWDLIFRQEVLIFGLALAIAISPALAIYRAVTSVIEAVALNVVRR
jgi:hypothetical protein